MTQFPTRTRAAGFRDCAPGRSFADMRTLILMCGLVLTTTCGGGGVCGGDPPASDVPSDHVLRDPDAAEMKVVPPDSFDVRLETTEGDVVIRFVRDWSPLGVQRVYNLARHGFYDGSRFFRVLPGFVAQFGVSGRPPLDSIWNEQKLFDDPQRQLNEGGTVAFAKTDANTRTTQLFVTYRSHEGLDQEGFVPVGRVVDGMGVLYRLNSDYGDIPPQGSGPSFGCMLTHGNAYLDQRYPELDVIERATVLEAEQMVP